VFRQSIGPGDTLEEARRNLEEAVLMVLEANRALSEEDIAGKSVLRENLSISGTRSGST